MGLEDPEDNPVQFVCASSEETRNQKEDRDCLESHGAAEDWLTLGAVGRHSAFPPLAHTLFERKTKAGGLTVS